MKKTLKKFFSKKVIGNEKGSMLVLSLLVSSIFVTFGAGYLGLVAVEAKNTQRTHGSNLAIHIAESGAEEAIWEIKYNNRDFTGWAGNDPVTKTASLTTASGENLGSYTVTVTGPAGNSPVIESAGSASYGSGFMSGDRTVGVTLQISNSSTYQYAAFAENSLKMEDSACTDSFDSSLADGYGVNGNQGSDGDIGTNSTSNEAVELEGSAIVNGDGVVGVSGNPDDVIDIEGSADITGSESALQSAYVIPSVSSPVGLPSNAELDLEGSESFTISSSGEYPSIKLGSSSVLTVTGNTTIYVTGELKLESSSQLIIADGADVEIYSDTSMKFESSALVNNVSEDPSKLSLFGTDSMVDSGSDSSIKFESSAQIYATVHAKNANIKMESSSSVYGSVIASDIKMESSACIHFDVALSGGGGSSGSNATVTLWQEK